MGGMIRNWLAGFYFYADDTLSSPGLSMLLALDFLAVFSELDQLFTRHKVHRLNQPWAKEVRLQKLSAFIPKSRFWIGGVRRSRSLFQRPEPPLYHLPHLLTEGHKKRTRGTNKGRLAILSEPSFLFIASCLEQITVPRHIGFPQGAFSAVQVLWSGRHTGGPWCAGEEGTVAAFVSHWKGLQVLTAMINHPEADIWKRPGKGSTF